MFKNNLHKGFENDNSECIKKDFDTDGEIQRSIRAIHLEGKWFALDQEKLETFQKQKIPETNILKVDLDTDFLPYLQKYLIEDNCCNSDTNGKTNSFQNNKKDQLNNTTSLDISNCSGGESNSSNCSSGSSGCSGNSNNNANISAGSSGSSGKISSKSSGNDCKSSGSDNKSGGSDNKSGSNDISGSSYHTVESRDRYDSCLHDHIDSVLEDNDAVVIDDDDDKDNMIIRDDLIIITDSGIDNKSASNNSDNKKGRDKRDDEICSDQGINKKVLKNGNNKYKSNVLCFQYDKHNHNIINKNSRSASNDADNEDDDDDDDEDEEEDYTSSSEGGRGF